METLIYESKSHKEQNDAFQEKRKLDEAKARDILDNLSEEAGFDGAAAATLGTTVPANAEGSTSSTDIAQYAPKVQFARDVISASLPAMIGFNQPLNGPVGFIFGFKERQETAIPGGATPDPEDPVIIRKLITTATYEVQFELTNEIIEDIDSMFSDDFPSIMDNFISSGGEVYGSDPSDFERFFVPQMLSKGTEKINDAFVAFLDAKATNKGIVTIASNTDMPLLFAAVGELREALYKSTGKSGNIFVLCSPRIASYVSTTLGATMSNNSRVVEAGRPIPSDRKNGFVLASGDITWYETDRLKDVTGGSAGTTAVAGSMIVGFMGDNGPNVASVYHTPYKEYLVQGGGDYATGQRSVFYRARTAFSTNPQDSYNQTLVTTPTITDDATTDGLSQYLMSCTVDMANVLVM